MIKTKQTNAITLGSQGTGPVELSTPIKTQLVVVPVHYLVADVKDRATIKSSLRAFELLFDDKAGYVFTVDYRPDAEFKVIDVSLKRRKVDNSSIKDYSEPDTFIFNIPKVDNDVKPDWSILGGPSITCDGDGYGMNISYTTAPTKLKVSDGKKAITTTCPAEIKSKKRKK